MKRISSGNDALDRILGGGFPVNSTNLIMGMPGTGKTVLAQSIAFHNATAEHPTLFISTVSEPLDRMLRYVQEFSFFDIEKIGEAVIYQEISDPLRTNGLVAAVEEIVALIKEHRPAYLVIDSFKALHSFSDSEKEFRSCLSTLSSVLSSLAITSFWVGEYSTDEIPDLPEFAVTDSIVELVLKKIGVGDVRYLRVSKLRGSSFFSGEHAFRIGEDGLQLYPRFTTTSDPIDYELAAARTPTGVEALDTMLAEGLWKGSSTLVFGPPGSGKTLLGLHFIFKGIEMGEKGLIATLQENPTQLQRIAMGFGWDVNEAIASGMLTLMYVSPVDVYIDEFVSRVTQKSLAEGAQRLLIDSVNDLRAASPADGRFRDFMYSLVQAMAVEGISVFMTHEVGDLFATTVLSKEGISHMSDNVILLSYLRDAAQIKRTISVIKTRASEHDAGIRLFTITSGGILLGGSIRVRQVSPRASRRSGHG